MKTYLLVVFLIEHQILVINIQRNVWLMEGRIK